MNVIEIDQLKRIKSEMSRFMLKYRFAIKEMETKIDILKEEFHSLHDYSPIEHTKSRLKSPESILNKALRKGCHMSLESIQQHIMDIAGLRITCSFISDIYRVSEMLQKQDDLTILAVKDYIANPKPNGYQSLHLLLEVPIFLSDSVEKIKVEVQIRTIAMDFWASLEHKIFYKYNKSVPEQLLKELKEAAISASELDKQMERLMREVEQIKSADHKSTGEAVQSIVISDQTFHVPTVLLELLSKE